MIDHHTLIDCSAIAAFGFIFCFAVGRICFRIGRHDSYLEGYHQGRRDARNFYIKRIMRAKIDGQRAGRILGLREAIQLTNGSGTSADNRQITKRSETTPGPLPPL